jgi:DNA replication protein DnaC
VNALDLMFYRTQYSTVADFSAAVRECYKDGAKHTEKQVMQRYTKPDLLVLDEVGASSGSDHEKQILFEAMNERYNNVLPTVLISNLTQADITAYLGERIMDRMREGGGKLLRLDWESYRK